MRSMGRKIQVTTAPETFEVPFAWEGCVTRDGKTFSEPVQASYWEPGDFVNCLVRVNGQLQPVSFIVGSVKLTD